MSDFLVYFASGLAVSGAYALLGIGIVVVHRVTQVVNLAQGSFAVLGAFGASTLLGHGVPHGLGELLSIAGCAAVGVVVGIVSLGRASTTPLSSLLLTLASSMVLAAVTVWFWGQAPASPPGLPGTVRILGADIENQRLLGIVAAVAAFAVIGLLFARTDHGRALTAAASNPLAARLVGIDVRRAGLVSFAVAGLLGGLAGVLAAPATPIAPEAALPLALSGFAAAVFGGLHSAGRTFAGALLLGITGQLAAGYLDGSFQTQLALVMMLVVMIARSGRLTVEEAK